MSEVTLRKVSLPPWTCPDGPSGVHSVAVHQERLHIARVRSARPGNTIEYQAAILDPAASRFITVAEGIAESRSGLALTAPTCAYRQIPGGDMGTMELLLGIQQGGQPALTLRWSPTSGALEKVSRPNAAVDAAFSCAACICTAKHAYGVHRDATGGISGLIDLNRPGGEQPLLLPMPPRGGRSLSDATIHDQAIYATISDAVLGFELWRLPLTDAACGHWEAVLERGAHRYAQNRDIFALASHRGSLFAIAGTAPALRTPKSKFLDYQGFELLRIEPDGWELIFGVPRFSPSGIKIPLSGLGPSLDAGARREFRGIVAHAGGLVLASSDIAGMHVATSVMGEDWIDGPIPGVGDFHRLHSGRTFSCGADLALLVEGFDAAGLHQTEVWLEDGRTQTAND